MLSGAGVDEATDDVAAEEITEEELVVFPPVLVFEAPPKLAEISARPVVCNVDQSDPEPDGTVLALLPTKATSKDPEKCKL